jgi:hypothetical protein
MSVSLGNRFVHRRTVSIITLRTRGITDTLSDNQDLFELQVSSDNMTFEYNNTQQPFTILTETIKGTLAGDGVL